MCLKESCEIVKFYQSDKGDSFFLHEFDDTGMRSLNYIEFLFNESKSGDFVFNQFISREMDKAILTRDVMPYLSPELVLLYKSENPERKSNQSDYDRTIAKMNSEQINWFNNSLDSLYSDGHVWRT